MSAFRTMRPVPIPRRSVWDELRDWVVDACGRGFARLRTRRNRRIDFAASLAAHLTGKVPRCEPCGGKRVERYVVVHEVEAQDVRVVVECHGRTRLRVLHARDTERLSYLEILDMLRVPAF
jgi:hypothetical protein